MHLSIGDEPFYIYNSSSDNIEIQDMATIDEKRKNHYILNLNRIIKNITALLDYNKSELNVNKKILCFIDYDNVIHTNKLIEIFQNKCILFNTLEPRFNLPINIIIILLKIDGRLEELKGSILEDIKQYKLIDNNYVIEKFILNKSTLIREK